MSDKAQAARELVRAAIQFADAASGAGVRINGAPHPDDFLPTYAAATGDDAMDTLPDRIAAMVAPVPEGAKIIPKELVDEFTVTFDRCKFLPEGDPKAMEALWRRRKLAEQIVNVKPISRGTQGGKGP